MIWNRHTLSTPVIRTSLWLGDAITLISAFDTDWSTHCKQGTPQTPTQSISGVSGDKFKLEQLSAPGLYRGKLRWDSFSRKVIVGFEW